MARLSIRIYLDPPHHGLGPGMVQLLEGVAAQGSIRKAAGEMTMSYRKAWLLLKNMEDTFGGPVVITSIGGKTGGGAKLTALGKTLLACYRRIERNATRSVAADLKALLALSRAKGRAKRK
ncbi:MAG: LysR family transcriptional regulator [Pseudomonadota bacterium]